MKTNDEILEWFYEHDIEWQNDIIAESDCGNNESALINYLRKHYFIAMKPTQKPEWQVEETENEFRLITPENFAIASYYYGKDLLKMQDEVQARYHDIAAKLNGYNDFVGLLKEIQYEVSFEVRHKIQAALRKTEG